MYEGLRFEPKIEINEESFVMKKKHFVQNSPAIYCGHEFY